MRKITKAQLIGGALFAGLALTVRIAERRRAFRPGWRPWVPTSDGDAIVAGFLMGAGLIAATAPIAPFFFVDD